jgi:prepilin-type N-terminal cleavage/methylation domain-containing protein
MRGVTLIELVVVLAILGVLSGVTAAAFGGLRRPEAGTWSSEVSRARAAAIRSGRRVVVQGDRGTRAVLLPDGRAVGAGLDPLTGEVLDAR